MVDDIGAGAERKFEVKSHHVQGSHFFISLPPEIPLFHLPCFKVSVPPKLPLALIRPFFFFGSAYMTGMYVRVQDILFRVDSLKKISRRLVQRFQGQP